MAADATYPNIVQRRTDGNLYVPTGKSLVVESGGTHDVSAGTFTLAASQIAAAALANPTANNVVAPGFKCAKFHYDATVQSGLIGTVPVAGATLIPINSLVLGGLVRVTSTAVGTGASVALQVEAANDTISVAAISGAPWSTTGLKAIVPVFTAATAILTTAARDLSVVITAANLTQLVFDAYLFYVVAF